MWLLNFLAAVFTLAELLLCIEMFGAETKKRYCALVCAISVFFLLLLDLWVLKVI